MPPLTPDFSQRPEVFISTPALALAISREAARGGLRKLGSRLYTRNLTEPPERLVQRHLWPAIAAILPGAIISDRTALENRPAPDGSVFLISDHKRDIEWPGVTLRPRKGPPALDTDRPFIGTLRIAHPPALSSKTCVPPAPAPESPALCRAAKSKSVSKLS